MPNLRNSTALRQLADLGHEPDPPVWDWAVTRLEPSGRILLSVSARAVLGALFDHRVDVWGRCRDATLVLGKEASGRRLSIDGRGRLYVPMLLRRGPVPWLLVGANVADSIVVVAPISVLDGLGEQLAAGR
ncbi:MAG: hypothetical protein ACR2LQ_03395 [Acidimicrobiales bacterium]